MSHFKEGDRVLNHSQGSIFLGQKGRISSIDSQSYTIRYEGGGYWTYSIGSLFEMFELIPPSWSGSLSEEVLL